MKTIVLGGGMFGFAILKHLWENNPSQEFYLYERDEGVFESLKTKRENPYFFEWVKLPGNIMFEENVEENIWEYDLIIVAIPAQFVINSIANFKEKLKSWVTILNLSKWINNETLQTIGEWLEAALTPNLSFGGEGEAQDFYYNYAVLSGWMIAGELVEQKILGADIAIKTVGYECIRTLPENLKQIFQSENLKINITKASTKSVELFGALKNITAISIWYYMWKWLAYSSLWYYLCKLLEEEKELIKILWGWEYFEFSDYSLGWDIVATCFWNSRNRYLWELLWKWNSAEEALEIMKQENKTAEWYFTLKAVAKIIEDKPWFEEIKKIVKILY